LAGLASDRGDVDGATRHWLRILERDAFDEGAHLELVKLLDRAGRRGEARRRYGLYAARMAEIDVEAAPFPSPVRAA
jgi:DNA-binding SARP family transcriptional activator